MLSALSAIFEPQNEPIFEPKSGFIFKLLFRQLGGQMMGRKPNQVVCEYIILTHHLVKQPETGIKPA